MISATWTHLAQTGRQIQVFVELEGHLDRPNRQRLGRRRHAWPLAKGPEPNRCADRGPGHHRHWRGGVSQDRQGADWVTVEAILLNPGCRLP
jgi:hypothetical protein